MKLNRYLIATVIVAVALLAAFAPPGVTFSKKTYIYKPTTATASTSSTALVDAGSGLAADSLTLGATNSASGWTVFPVHETTGTEIHFAMTGAAGTTGTARIFRVLPIGTSPTNSSPVQWTYRHLCDVSLVASSQTGVASGTVTNSQRYAICTVYNDAGLQPIGSRTLNGLSVGAGGSVVIDGLCAPFIAVQTKVGTATDITTFASDWTRN